MTYKQWIRPSLPNAYITDRGKPPKDNASAGKDNGQAEKKREKRKPDSAPTEEKNNYIHNPKFDTDLKNQHLSQKGSTS
jgi:hypothetical protein